jgi:hypothetical protein
MRSEFRTAGYLSLRNKTARVDDRLQRVLQGIRSDMRSFMPSTSSLSRTIHANMGAPIWHALQRMAMVSV